MPFLRTISYFLCIITTVHLLFTEIYFLLFSFLVKGKNGGATGGQLNLGAYPQMQNLTLPQGLTLIFETKGSPFLFCG